MRTGVTLIEDVKRLRGTSKIFEGDEKFSLSIGSYQPEIDKDIIIEIADKCVKLKRGRESIDNIITELLLRSGLRGSATKMPCFWMKKLSYSYDVTLAAGGDNYCYGGTERYYRLNKSIRRNKIKNIFWGCSVESDVIDNNMLKDLHGFDIIIARETLTFQALAERGLKNLAQCADPAFAMEADISQIPAGVVPKGNIGINISPLTFSYSQNSKAMKRYIIQLIQHILSCTDYNILLIPHVHTHLEDVNSDSYVNNQIFHQISDPRIYCVSGDLNAPQLKGIIAHCDLFIGARTHATIAAYSSCVPTLVLGYSIKSKGIATDLFGTYKGNVIPVQNVSSSADLKNSFDEFYEEKGHLKKKLEEVMSNYIASAYSAKKILSNLWDKNENHKK
jgi:colanic acid/amylovoran biosynthesis protein